MSKQQIKKLIDNINFTLRTRFNLDFHYEIQGKSFVKVSEKEQEVYVSDCKPTEMLALLTLLSAVIDDL